MPNFANPFQGNVNRKMTNAELMQGNPASISPANWKPYLYESHILATDDLAAKKVLEDIRDEEKAHMGELITLMRYLDPSETDHFLAGESEVKEMLEDLGITKNAEVKTGMTVGSLKE